MTGRSKVRIFDSRSRLRRVDAASVRSRHAPYSYTRPRPRLPPMALSHENIRQRDTKHTAVHALYCSMCLAVLRIPTCAPTELPPPNVHCLCPNPLASAGRCGHPHHSASCEIVHHRWWHHCGHHHRHHSLARIIIMPAMHSSPRDMSQHPDALAAAPRTMQVIPPTHAGPFGHLVIWSFGRLSVGLWDPVAPAAVFTGRSNWEGAGWGRGAAAGRHAAIAPFPP